MIHIFVWYLMVAVLGLLAWPVLFALLPGLEDRGYAFSRVVGLLLVGYVFWLLGTLGLLQNTPGGIILAALIIAGISFWVYRRRADREESLLSWVRSHTRYVSMAELLFAAAYIAWTIVRALNPELNSTERPMELAFLNGVVHSPNLPPLDPWLAGYAISYYYFGYVLIGMLARLAETPVSVAFNIGVALLFGLTVLNSFSLVYNLNARIEPRRNPVFASILGPLFVAVIGNFEGLLELVKALNFSFIGPGFWTWLDIQDLTEPVSRVLWPPDTWRYLWWWRASRVIQDRDLTGAAIGLQPIDEFPMFSFILGDMHPHVLALPFVLVAVSFALNIYAQREEMSRSQIGLYVIFFGGLAFLNTWDLPIYFFILGAALVLRQFRADGKFILRNFQKPILDALVVLALGILAYITWYIGFASQAGGILPNALFPTRLQQYLVMFGPFMVLIGVYLASKVVALWSSLPLGKALIAGFGLLVLLAIVMSGLGLASVATNNDTRNYLLESAGYVTSGMTPDQVSAAVPDALSAVLANRLLHPLTPLFLVLIIGVTLAVLFAHKRTDEPKNTAEPAVDIPTSFVLVIILTASLLTLGPEFVYLRDYFQQRLNTVFKFYYAAWILFAVASAYTVYAIFRQGSRLWTGAMVVVTSLTIAGGLVYPVLAIPTKIGPVIRSSQDAPITLDGIDYLHRASPSDYNGILWLQNNAQPGSIVLEAVGGSYNANFGRVSGATGLPTLMGWPGHESQWRGALFAQAAGAREADVREIYNTTSIARAQELLAQYHVKYVFVGSSESDPSYASPVGLQKFDRFITAVFRDGNTVIYRADMPVVGETP